MPQAALPLREKVRILLELQRQDLPLIRCRRPLRSWERPWPIGVRDAGRLLGVSHQRIHQLLEE